MDSYLYLGGQAVPKMAVIDMGTYLREEYTGEVYDPRPFQDIVSFLLGGWLLFIFNAVTSFYRTKPSYERIPMFVIALTDGNMYEIAYGRGFGLSKRDVKRMLKDFRKHPELYARRA